MAKLLKLRRGTTSQHNTFTGAEGEVTIDTTKDTAVVHDGSQAGGRPLAREDMSNVSSSSIAGRLGADSIATTKIAAGTLPSDVKITDSNVSGNLTITSADIVNGTIVNADIASNAAIAGTKLENSGVTAGQYGSSSAIPIVTVDAQGLVTAASTTAIDSTTIANGSASVAVSNNGPITSNANHDFSAGIDVTGNITSTGKVQAGDDVEVTVSSGDAFIVTKGGTNQGHLVKKADGTTVAGITNGGAVGGSVNDCAVFSPNAVRILAGGTNQANNLILNVTSGGVGVTGDISVTGTVDGVDVAALKTSKDSLSTTNGTILGSVSLAQGVSAQTQGQADNSTKVATTAYVRTAISEAQAFPSGTKMLFQQTSAPTGWTKITSGVDNKALRVVSGTAGSGGTNAFTNTLASRGINANAGNTTAGGNVSSNASNTTAGGNVSVSVGNSGVSGNVSIGNTASGGNVSIGNTSTGGTVNSHTLSVNQIPSHSHNADTKLQQHNCRGNACPGFARGNSGGNYQSATTHNTGGNGGHSHGFSGSSHNHNASFSGSNHNHNASFSGASHSHNANGSFSGTAHNHNVSSSFSGTAHNHSISVGNLDMAVQYLDVIVASKN